MKKLSRKKISFNLALGLITISSPLIAACTSSNEVPEDIDYEGELNKYISYLNSQSVGIETKTFDIPRTH
jgi:hypothetical protein